MRTAQRSLRAADTSAAEKAIHGLLKRTPLFSIWPDALLIRLCKACALRNYVDGQTIARRGDKALGLLVVVSGTIKTSRTWANGKRMVFGHLTPGQLTNIVPVVDRGPVLFDCVASGPTQVALVPAAAFTDAISRHGELALAVAEMMCRRSRFDYENIQMLSMNTSLVRVAKYLLFLNHDPNIRLIGIGVSQEEIASTLGLTRQSVITSMKRLTKDGIIVKKYRNIFVNDIPKLLEICESEAPLSPEIVEVLAAPPEDLLGAHY